MTSEYVHVCVCIISDNGSLSMVYADCGISDIIRIYHNCSKVGHLAPRGLTSDDKR